MTSFVLFFCPHHASCGTLVPRPGIEPVLHAVEARSLNHWTAREAPDRMPCLYPSASKSFPHAAARVIFKNISQLMPLSCLKLSGVFSLDLE